MLIAWCMGVTLELTMHSGCQNGRSRSETKRVANSRKGLVNRLKGRRIAPVVNLHVPEGWLGR
jgi:hypothetical protein